jgi:hypothetical protein
LQQFNIGAAYIIAGSAGFPCIIGCGTDLATELAAARKVWPKSLDPPVLAAAWWCFDLRTAQQIATLAVASDLRRISKEGPRLAVSVTDASSAIIAAAGRLHFRLTDHAAVLARAKAAGASLERRGRACVRCWLRLRLGSSTAISFGGCSRVSEPTYCTAFTRPVMRWRGEG